MKSYAIVGHFDEIIENKIIGIWKVLNDKGISNYGYTYKERLPHMTFIDLKSDTAEEIIGIMKTLRVSSLDIKLQSTAVFPGTKTIYYPLLKSSDLLDFHEYLSEQFYRFMPFNSLYKKDHWLAHTTIASRLSDEDMSKVYSIAELEEELTGKVDKLLLLEIESTNEVKIILEIDLNDSVKIIV